MAEWRRVRLGDLFEIKHGFAFPGSEFSDDPLCPTLVTPANFRIGGGFKVAKTKTFAGEVPEDYVLDPGSLIVTMTDLSKSADTLGLGAIVPSGATYLHNQRIGLVVPKSDDCVPEFMNYFFRTPEYRSYIVGTASGSTVRHTSPTRIKDFVAALPERNAQRAIADVLGALDDKIAANTKLATTADELAMFIYRRAVSTVGRVAMSSRLEPVLGGTPTRSNANYWGGDVPWTSAKDITGAGHGVVLETDEYITARAASATKAKPLPQGSVILTARGTVGAVARLGVPAAFNQSCYGFVPGDVPPGVLYFAVSSAAAEARALAHGSVFDTITKKTFDYLGFPDLDHASMTALEGEIGPLLDSVTAIERENQQLAATRDALLPALMSGKLRVEEAAEVAGL